MLTARAVAGMRWPVCGLEGHAALLSSTQLEASPHEPTLNQALAPFAACRLEPTATRDETIDLLAIDEVERNRAMSVVAPLWENGITRIISVCPFAKNARKRWPLDRFIAVCHAIVTDSPSTGLCFVGGEQDLDASAHVAAGLPARKSVVAAGRLTVRETFALLGHTSLFVGNDGAPMHLAALAGVPVAGIFCNWDVPGLWEPIAAPRSESIRPEWTVDRKSGFGMSAILAGHVLTAVRSLQVPLCHETLDQHAITWIDGTGETRRLVASHTPFTSPVVAVDASQQRGRGEADTVRTPRQSGRA
jgi:ADP-heptose:LPS heptosyltransferase